MAVLRPNYVATLNIDSSTYIAANLLMLNAIVIAIRFINLVYSSHKQVALENAALPQQLAVFSRVVKRPKLEGR
jgi:hypothetical protein